jgi:type IV secretory pathway VirB10-like protein
VLGADGEVDLNKVEVDAGDKARLSLKTGATQAMQALKTPAAAVPGDQMDEQEMLAEMDNSRRWFIIAGAIVLVAVVAVVLYVLLGRQEAPAPPPKAEAPPAPTAVATAPPAPTPAPAPAPAAPKANAPPEAVPAPPHPAPTPAPTEASPAQLLDDARAAAAKDNLTLAVDLLTRALAAGADAKAAKKLEANLTARVQKKFVAAKKSKDRAGEAEAKALRARLASIGSAKKK